MSHAEQYLEEAARICSALNTAEIERMADSLCDLRSRNGRLFIIGLGGSAANASHAANDFISLCAIHATCLSDNVAELTATANDYGWENCYELMLGNRHAVFNDALLVLSVGGGTSEVSLPLVAAIDYAKDLSIPVLGIVGRDGGETKRRGDCVIVIPTIEGRVTPHTEAFQSVILHLLASHPKLQRKPTTW